MRASEEEVAESEVQYKDNESASSQAGQEEEQLQFVDVKVGEKMAVKFAVATDKDLDPRNSQMGQSFGLRIHSVVTPTRAEKSSGGKLEKLSPPSLLEEERLSRNLIAGLSELQNSSRSDFEQS